MRRIFSLNNYLLRLGGWYITFIVVVAQFTAILGAIWGAIVIYFNAELTPNLMWTISFYTMACRALADLIMLGVVWYLTPTARKRLTEWATNTVRTDPKEEVNAWREITALTWQYGMIAVVVAYLVGIFPPSLYFRLHNDISVDQFIYLLLGGLVSVLAIIIIASLVIDRLLIPARLTLVPKNFEPQLAGLAGPRLTFKFQVLILTLVTIGILVVGPIGFHYLNQRSIVDLQYLRRNFQYETSIITLLVLLFGFGLSFFISRTVSSPLKDLIAVFNAVEAGDLSLRAKITATDEIAEVIMHFNQMVAGLEELHTTLEKQVDERTRLLKATNDLAKVSSSILDPDELLARVINLFTEQFNYYYAGIYLIDPSEKWVELVEATGEAGKVLRQNRHRYELAGKSMVASCIQERSPRIVQNTSGEKQRVENPLLPYTRSEVALPLMVGDRALGALNVQSTKPSDFGSSIIETMQNMAGQVAIALENARLFQETSQRIQEMRTIQQQYLREGWGALDFKKDDLEYGVGESALDNTQQLIVPINLRDQMIGQLTIEGSEPWTTDQKSLIDAVTAQAAVALENARLVNESRQIALRERTLAEINSKIWASTTLDGVLQTAIKELGKRLDASSVSIELSLDDQS